ncbi:tetratricopeptide repeat protein [Tepidiforma bonchosmolovskayae]|uniref:Tetratricopeptide repeat protein n=1 Tax=Tepidiforma bonchosmolovskayae TaxID=2601677 RepID=A0ABX6C0F3_9CHLR|nr:tetratricopeptide repeat protein [Tepidiforma bonchosmolovskayae]QFG01896.1 tetratricopeptide repeat protein [Tepidiforma bonchosmolovskayae]
MTATLTTSTRPRANPGGRIAVPRLPRRLVARPAVVARIHEAIGNGVIAVIAPAGFGKSTAVALALEEVDYEPRWVSLDSTAHAPEALAHQLGCALYRNRLAPPPPTALRLSDLQAYIGAAVHDVSASTPRPLLLVIDNVHELADSHESLQLLGWLIEAMSDGHEVVLVGRELPFLPAINERVATGEVTVIDASVLAFSADEVRAAIEVTGARLDPGQVLEQTGGWPVGVMATLAGDAVSGVSAADFHRYLASEVWARVPADLRQVLHRLALQPSIERSFVEIEFGLRAWRDLVAWLSRRDFLCEHLSPREFRLNPLLRQFIAEDFAAADPDGFQAAMEEVLASLTRMGRYAEAVELARSQGTELQLAGLLARHGHHLIIRGSFSLLKEAFAALGHATLERDPLLQALKARVEAHVGDPEEALRLAALVLGAPDARGAVRIHAHLARLRALRLLGRHEELLAEAEHLRAIDWSGDAALRAEVVFQRAEIELSVTRNFQRAEELLRLAIDEAERHQVSPLDLLARSTLGQALAMHGDAPAAVTMLTRAAQGWRALGRSSNLGWTLNNLGMAHLDAGDFRSAVAVLEEAVAEGIACGNRRNVAYATGSLGDAELALGHFRKAQEHFEEAIRICANEALDETLAALAIGGLSAAYLGQGDLQQADFFARRAMLVALASGNPYEIAYCRLRQAAVDLAAGNAASAVSLAREAAEAFEQMDVAPMAAAGWYRVAMAQFRANRRAEAQESLAKCAEAIRQPWMTQSLIPLVRENPMFAQWAASRPAAGRWFRDILERQSFLVSGDAAEPNAEPGTGRFPRVVARSLGRVAVTVGGRQVSDEQWASVRAKELFFLLLAHRDGIRKEQAVEMLYPELPREKCNSAFHSNLYRVRRALYQDCVVKQDGAYLLNPEGQFEWDVEKFEAAVERAHRAQPGSKERALAFQEALELYEGPFAEVFESEWAAGVRTRLHEAAHASLAALAGYFAARNDFESAVLCLERILRNDRFNEEAAYELARYRSRAGQAVQALHFIDQYAELYEQELGEPLPERFFELRAAIAAGVAV